MAANAVIPYDGYPQPAGAKRECSGDFFGTANYQAGGYNVNCQPFGFTRFEHLTLGTSQSNNYQARAHFPANTSVGGEARATGNNNFVVCIYAANGTEVANNSNLAAEVFQFYARGI